MTRVTSVEHEMQYPIEEVEAQNRHIPITPLPKMQLCGEQDIRVGYITYTYNSSPLTYAIL